MTNKWQCSKCKQLKKTNVRTRKIKIGKESKIAINPDDIHKIKCCCRVMRNLSEDVYKKELEINKSGLRGVENA